jgi:hypothetical protein
MKAEDLELLSEISRDRALGSSLLFSHRHSDDSPAFHIELLDLWRCADPFVLIEAFRGAGKSTLSEEFLTLEGCFGNFHYWLLLGETYSKACQRLAAIDYECRTNKKLNHLFGGKVLARKSIENKVWFQSGALIEAMGWEQELQGLKEQADRPDGAYFDDVENLERVRDTEAVDRGMQKLFLELMPALDPVRRRIRFAQARRAEDCMVTRLAANPEWLYRAFPICNGEPDDPLTESLWPARYPMEWIRKERDTFQRAGMIGAFLQSYMLQATDYSAKPFKEEMLASMEVSPWHWMPRYAIYDPSRTSNEKRTKEVSKSDRTGKVVVSRMGSKILVHESSGNFWEPNEFINDLFLTQEQHSPAKIGIEKNSLDDWLMQPIRIEMMRRGIALPLKALIAPQDRSKDEFIGGLQPFALAKDIVLIGGKMAHPQLVAEWSNFPNGPRDVMNALAYSLRMFSGVPMYEDFSGANINDAPNPRLGETVYIAFNANPSEAVAVAVVREGRRLSVAGDWSASGATADAVKTLAFEVRTAYPRAAIQSWVPAETYDQWQRVALVPALRAERFVPYRAEHVAVARGCLAERMRMDWHGRRLFTVDKDAKLTLNSLAAGYALAVEKGGRSGHEPEPGISRLVAEAIEAMVAMLDRQGDVEAIPKGANIAYTPGGQRYVSSNPRART